MSTTTPQQSGPPDEGAAANLVRTRINEIYSKFSSNPPTPKPKESLLQRFWELHGSADDHHAAWEIFYASLPDDQKHELWNEYHQTQFSHNDPPVGSVVTPEPTPAPVAAQPATATTNPVVQAQVTPTAAASPAPHPEPTPVQAAPAPSPAPAPTVAMNPTPAPAPQTVAPHPEPIVHTPEGNIPTKTSPQQKPEPAQVAKKEQPETKPAETQPPKAEKKKASKSKKTFATFHIPGNEQVDADEPKQEPTLEIAMPDVIDHPSVTANVIKPKPEVASKTVAQTKEQLLKGLQVTNKSSKSWLRKHRGPLLTALIVMSTIVFLNYNHVAVATVKKYVSPGDSLSSPIIIDPNVVIDVGDEPRVIIPKINVDVPVVYDIKTYEEKEIQEGLERGVVHYGETPLPGEGGNNVIVGHSSSNFFNGGKYKFAFVLLDRLELNDTFILHYEGVRYVYKITNKQIIQPDDFSLIQPTSKPTTTLITCSPPGTNWQRLVIQGEQISPSPNSNPAQQQTISPEEQDINIVPGNSPSLWERFSNWIF